MLPWPALIALIEPVYPKSEDAGRSPVGLDRMLRIHFLQHWFNLSDPAVEEALYDSRAMREFVGIDLGHEPVPDETMILKFRHLLEREELGPKILACMNGYLAERDFKVTTGTIVDATIIAALSSTKNRDGQRDPEMRQTKKGNAWHFGMKAHVGVDSATKIIHSVAATPANLHDSRLLSELLHGDETRVGGKGEHPFLILKCVFGFAKVRYRGIAKNAQRLFVACALVNVYLLRRPLLHAT
jgi:IS5 family transposase